MKNIVENNKLLAEFLEFEKVKFLNGCYTFIIPDYLSHGEYKNLTLEDNKEVVAWDVENLIFHKDWNWLMEVVEKIENYNEFTNVLFAPQGCSIDCYTENRFSFSNDCDTKIEAVYNACVEFVKWYNEQKLIDILIK